jgi:hypothetical protein
MAVRKDTIKGQVREALGQVLEPGEEVVAGVHAVAGPSPLLTAGVLGLIGQFMLTYYWVAVTDRRVLFLTLSRLSLRPEGLGRAEPRSAVEVTRYRTSAVWSVLKVRGSDGKEVRLNVHRIWREELEAVAGALGASTSGP